VFGLVDGPCARGADGPEVAGFRPDGNSPEGVADLAGNVAEWVREPEGNAQAFGGSFRSALAGGLKSWAGQARDDTADDVGFRCVYQLGGASPKRDP
jgi:formylglycine-generating enzyme required for sulfatase activity